MIATTPFDLIRPLLWVAAVAFVLGFAGYALMGGGSIARTIVEQPMLSPIGTPYAPSEYDGPTIIA